MPNSLEVPLGFAVRHSIDVGMLTFDGPTTPYYWYTLEGDTVAWRTSVRELEVSGITNLHRMIVEIVDD